jgi:cytochrome c peroxidase
MKYAALLSVFMLCACGGGGGSSGAPTNTGPVQSSTPTPPANRDPILLKPHGDQFVHQGFPFTYDVNANGEYFSDPDGNQLTYVITFSPNDALYTAVGSEIRSTSSMPGSALVTVIAMDGHGAEIADKFELLPGMNSGPEVVQPNHNRVVAAGTPIDYDLAQGGATFRDPDGDSLSYHVTLSSEAPGFSIEGTHIKGTMSGIGFVRGQIEASDHYGGTVTDEFGFVVPTDLTSEPSLAKPSYIYADAELPLPPIYADANQHFSQFWDTQPTNNRTTNAGATLGRVLFYDKRMSVTNTVACASCHEQAKGFAGPRFGTGCFGDLTKRSPMALTDVRYNISNFYFSDARVDTLEKLVSVPLQSSAELGSDLDQLEAELAATKFYPPLFQAAFGSPDVTRERIAKAVAQFLRSLFSYQSKFDRAMFPMDPNAVPDLSLFTPQELRGRAIFDEKECWWCHDSAIHTNDVPENNGIDEAFTDPGNGLGHFRASSLRNIAVSGPYMHDGRFATLREVIDHYDSGVKDSPNTSNFLREPMVPSAPIRQMHLSEADKQALEAFFNTLTDTAFLTDPRLSNPFPD